MSSHRFHGFDDRSSTAVRLEGIKEISTEGENGRGSRLRSDQLDESWCTHHKFTVVVAVAENPDRCLAQREPMGFPQEVNAPSGSYAKMNCRLCK
jgi:hypothetical protein